MIKKINKGIYAEGEFHEDSLKLFAAVLLRGRHSHSHSAQEAGKRNHGTVKATN